MNEILIHLIKIVKGYYGLHNKKYIETLKSQYPDLWRIALNYKYEQVKILPCSYDECYPRKKKNLKAVSKRAVEKSFNIEIKDPEREFENIVSRVIAGENVRPAKIAKLLATLNDFSFVNEDRLSQFFQNELVCLIWERIRRDRFEN